MKQIDGAPHLQTKFLRKNEIPKLRKRRRAARATAGDLYILYIFFPPFRRGDTGGSAISWRVGPLGLLFFVKQPTVLDLLFFLLHQPDNNTIHHHQGRRAQHQQLFNTTLRRPVFYLPHLIDCARQYYHGRRSVVLQGAQRQQDRHQLTFSHLLSLAISQLF